MRSSFNWSGEALQDLPACPGLSFPKEAASRGPGGGGWSLAGGGGEARVPGSHALFRATLREQCCLPPEGA